MKKVWSIGTAMRGGLDIMVHILPEFWPIMTHLEPWSPMVTHHFLFNVRNFHKYFEMIQCFCGGRSNHKKNQTNLYLFIFTTCIIVITILISVSAIGTDGWMRWPRNSMFKHQTLTHSLGFVTTPSSSSSSWPLRSPWPSLLQSQETLRPSGLNLKPRVPILLPKQMISVLIFGFLSQHPDNRKTWYTNVLPY